MRKSHFMVSILTVAVLAILFSCDSTLAISSIPASSSSSTGAVIDPSSLPSGTITPTCFGPSIYTYAPVGNSCSISPSTAPTSDGKLAKLTLLPGNSFQIEVKKSSGNEIYSGTAGDNLKSITVTKGSGAATAGDHVLLSSLTSAYDDVKKILADFSAVQGVQSSVFAEYDVDKVRETPATVPALSFSRSPFTSLIRSFGTVKGDIINSVDIMIKQIVGDVSSAVADDSIPAPKFKDKDSTDQTSVALPDFDSKDVVTFYAVTDKITSTNRKVTDSTSKTIVGQNRLLGDALNDPNWISAHAELVATSLSTFGRKDKDMISKGYIPFGNVNGIKILQPEIVGGGTVPKSAYIGPEVLYGVDKLPSMGSSSTATVIKEVVSGIPDAISVQNQLKKKIVEFLNEPGSDTSSDAIKSLRMKKYLLARKFDFVQQIDLPYSGSDRASFANFPNDRIGEGSKHIGSKLYSAFSKGLKEIDSSSKKMKWSEVVAHFKNVDNYDHSAIAASIRTMKSMDEIEHQTASVLGIDSYVSTQSPSRRVYSPMILLGIEEKTVNNTKKYNFIADVASNIKSSDVKSYLLNSENYNKVCVAGNDGNCKVGLEKVQNNLVIDHLIGGGKSAVDAARYLQSTVSLEVMIKMLKSDEGFKSVYGDKKPKFNGIFDLYSSNVFRDANVINAVVEDTNKYSRGSDSVKILIGSGDSEVNLVGFYPFLVHKYGDDALNPTPGYVWTKDVVGGNLDSNYLAADSKLVLEKLAGVETDAIYGDTELTALINDTAKTNNATKKEKLLVKYVQRLNPEYQTDLLRNTFVKYVDSDKVSKKDTVKSFMDMLLKPENYKGKNSESFQDILAGLKNKIPGSDKYLPELLYYDIPGARLKPLIALDEVSKRWRVKVGSENNPVINNIDVLFDSVDDFVRSQDDVATYLDLSGVNFNHKSVDSLRADQMQWSSLSNITLSNLEFVIFSNDSTVNTQKLNRILTDVLFDESYNDQDLPAIGRIYLQRKFLESFIKNINDDSTVADKGKEVSKYIKIFGNKDDKSTDIETVNGRVDIDKDYKDIGKELSADVSEIFVKSSSYEKLHQTLSSQFQRKADDSIELDKSIDWRDYVIDSSDCTVLEYIKSINLRSDLDSNSGQYISLAKYLPVQVVRGNKKEIILLKDLLVSDLHGLSYGYGSIVVPDDASTDANRAKMDPKNSHLNMILTSFIRDNFIAESETSAHNAKGVLGYSEDKLKKLVKVVQGEFGDSASAEEKKKFVDDENSRILSGIVKNVLAKVQWSGEVAVAPIVPVDSEEKTSAGASVQYIKNSIFNGATDDNKNQVDVNAIKAFFTRDAGEKSEKFGELEQKLSEIRLLFESSFEDKLNAEREAMAHPVHGTSKSGNKLNKKTELDAKLDELRVLHAEHYMGLRREKPVHIKPEGMLSSIDSLFSKNGNNYSIIGSSKASIATVMKSADNKVSGEVIKADDKVFGKSGRALWYLRKKDNTVGDVKYVKVFAQEDLTGADEANKIKVQSLFNDAFMDDLKEFILRKENADLAADFVDFKHDLSADVDHLADYYHELLNLRKNIHHIGDILPGSIANINGDIQGKLGEKIALEQKKDKTKEDLEKISKLGNIIEELKAKKGDLEKSYNILKPRYDRLKVIYDAKKSKFGFADKVGAVHEDGVKGVHVLDTKETYALSLVRQAIKDAGIISGDNTVQSNNNLIRLGDNNLGSPLSKHRYNKDFLGTFSEKSTPNKDKKYDYLLDDELAVVYNSKVFLQDDKFKSINELALESMMASFIMKNDNAKLAVKEDKLNRVISKLSDGFVESPLLDSDERMINKIKFFKDGYTYFINQCWGLNKMGCGIYNSSNKNRRDDISSIGYIDINSQGIRAMNSAPSAYPDIAFNHRLYHNMKYFIISNNLLGDVSEVIGFNRLRDSVKSKDENNSRSIKTAKSGLSNRQSTAFVEQNEITWNNGVDAEQNAITAAERVYKTAVADFVTAEKLAVEGIIITAKTAIQDKNRDASADDAVKRFKDAFDMVFSEDFKDRFAQADNKLKLFDEEIGEFGDKYHLGEYRKKITDIFEDSIVRIYDPKIDSHRRDIISGLSDLDWVNILDGKSAFVLDVAPAENSMGKGYRAHMFINDDKVLSDKISYYGGMSGDDGEAILSLPRFVANVAEQLLSDSKKFDYYGIDDLLGYIQFNMRNEILGKKLVIPISKKDIMLIGNSSLDEDEESRRLALHSILSDPNNGREINKHLNKLSAAQFMDKFTSVKSVLYSDTPDNKYSDFIVGIADSRYDMDFFANKAGIHSMRIQSYDIDDNELINPPAVVPKFGEKIDDMSLTSYWVRSDLLAQEAYIRMYNFVMNTRLDVSCQGTKAQKIVCSKEIEGNKAANIVYKDQIYRMVRRNMDDIAESADDKMAFYNSNFYDNNGLFYNRSVNKYALKTDDKLFGIEDKDLLNGYYVDSYADVDSQGNRKTDDLFSSLEDIIIDSCLEYSDKNYYECKKWGSNSEKLLDEDAVLKKFKDHGYGLIQVENGINGIERHEFGAWSDKSTVRRFIDVNKQEVMRSLISDDQDLTIGDANDVKYRDLLSSVVKSDPLKAHQKFLGFLSSADKDLFRSIAENGKVEDRKLLQLVSNVADLFEESGVAWMTVDANVNNANKKCFIYKADCNGAGYSEFSKWISQDSGKMSSEVAASLAKNKHFVSKVQAKTGSFKLSDFAAGVIYWGMDEDKREFLSTYHDDDLVVAAKKYIDSAKTDYPNIGELKLRGYYDDSISRIGSQKELELKLSDLKKDFSNYDNAAINFNEDELDDNAKKYLALYHLGVVGSKLDIVADTILGDSDNNVEAVIESYFADNNHRNVYNNELIRKLYFKLIHVLRKSDNNDLVQLSIYKDLDDDMFSETEYASRNYIIINGQEINGSNNHDKAIINGEEVSVYRDAVTFFDFSKMLDNMDLDKDSKKDLFRNVIYDSLRKEGLYRPEISKVINCNKFIMSDLSSSIIQDYVSSSKSMLGIINSNIFGKNFVAMNSIGNGNIRFNLDDNISVSIGSRLGYLYSFNRLGSALFEQNGFIAGLSGIINYSIDSHELTGILDTNHMISAIYSEDINDVNTMQSIFAVASGYKFNSENGFLGVLINGNYNHHEIFKHELRNNWSYGISSELVGSYDLAIDKYSNVNVILGISNSYNNMKSLAMNSNISARYYNDFASVIISYGLSNINSEIIHKFRIGLLLNI